MKVRISEIRKVVREGLKKYLEDVDRVRRHKDGYGDDMEEDVDRVRRHKDGYGDQLEECGDDMGMSPVAGPHEEPDGDEGMQLIVVPVEGKKKPLSHAAPSGVEDGYPGPPVGEVTPPGMEKTVKGLKKDKDVDNPWAVAWSIKNKKGE